MNFEQWWLTTSPDFREDVESNHNPTKEKIKDFAVDAEIEESMDGVDVLIYSQLVSKKERLLEFFFNWRKDLSEVFYTKSLGQQQVAFLEVEND